MAHSGIRLLKMEYEGPAAERGEWTKAALMKSAWSGMGLEGIAG
jgi:hypothetical protein